MRRFANGSVIASMVVSTTMLGSARAEERRTIPDYDGRPDRPDTSDVAVWVPRILASPLYFTSEFLLRRPLGAITREVEDAAEDTPEKSPWRFAPIIAADVGFHPWFGLQAARERTFAPNNTAHAELAFGGVHTLLAGLADDLGLSARTSISAFGTVTRRDDAIFDGIGPSSSSAARIRYGYDRLETGLGFRLALGATSALHAKAGVRGTRFSDPNEIATRDYMLAFQGASLLLDTRTDATRPGSGIRFELDGQNAIETESAHRAQYVKWGGQTTVSLDLTGRRRVISLSVAARFVDSISGEAPPLNEQVTLGGDRYLRGFLYGRLVGRSALVTALQYEWPVWEWLDGFVLAELGDVFGKHLEGFTPSLLRTSYTLGLRAIGANATVEIFGGFGTETFEDRLRVSSGRLLLLVSRPL